MFSLALAKLFIFSAIDIHTDRVGKNPTLRMYSQVYHSDSTPNPYGGLPVRSEELISIFQVRATNKQTDKQANT